MKTPERVALAKALRAQGLNARVIAGMLSVGRSTVAGWLDDDHAAKQRARRARYSKPCVDCGASTDGSGGFKVQAERCSPCRRRWQADNARWTPEAIIEAVRRWASEHGRQPNAADWGSSGEWWPATTTVRLVFGSWNAAIAAAGFVPIDMNQKAFDDPDAIPRTVEMYRAGVPLAEIAEREGISIEGVAVRLRGRAARTRQVERSRRADAMVAEYAAGRPVAEVAAEYGVSVVAVYSAAHHRGVWRRGRRRVAA